MHIDIGGMPALVDEIHALVQMVDYHVALLVMGLDLQVEGDGHGVVVDGCV